MSTAGLEQQRLFIGGEWMEASASSTFERVDPYSGEVVTRAAAGTSTASARANA